MEFLVGKNDKFEIFGNDYNTIDGTAIRDYIHVTDLAKAHVLSLRFLEGHNDNLTLNLGTNNGVSVLEFIN